MSDALFVDTDAFLAYFSSKDPHHKKARSIIDQAKGIIITDCTTFAVIQRLGIKNILSFDKHFQQYGIAVL